MDPIAHTFTGAALAGAGLRRASPLAAATLIVAANAPDIDVFAYWFGDQYASLAFRRGWTHGLLALVIWPFVLAGVMLAWDRLVRRRRRPDAEPARAGPLALVAALGVLTHPALDWLNNYGMRWLMPFDGRWFYGDALFIVDPWVWLALGGALFLAHSRSWGGIVAWAALAALLSLLVLGTDRVPLAARVLWVGWLAALAAVRLARRGAVPARPLSPPRPLAAERLLQGALVATGVYVFGMIAADALARRTVAREALALGIQDVQGVMVAPAPANPFAGTAVIETPDAYYRGRFGWFAAPRLALTAEPILRGADPDVVAAASATRAAADFLTWARFPFFVVRERKQGYRVRIGDARYEDEAAAGSLRGLVVDLDGQLRPVGVY
jgi:inner membrane protein